ncbi:receptor-type tyrosine-protein phosphatase F-like isoform X1 [Haliotis rufescens]|uniref:receptor-type tyrosine-protein phosphatase F-like isoform X1 n=1 Tax=Haliotis rufescens TaxID=6454 RepID=UPI00201EE775|nr:receptor-type tyrosine-protein phosphatase F-like isoform X1 [Haliotis rufescens]
MHTLAVVSVTRFVYTRMTYLEPIFFLVAVSNMAVLQSSNTLCLTALLVVWQPCTALGMIEAIIAGCVGGVGVVVIIITIIVVIVLLLRRRRRQRHFFSDTGAIYENVSRPRTVLPVGAGEETEETRKTNGKKRTTDNALPEMKKRQTSLDVETVSPNAASSTEIPISTLGTYVAQMKKTGSFETEYLKLPSGFTGSYEVSQKPEHNGKNKFTGLYPYDYNRVVLTAFPGDPGSTYINASHVNGYRKDKSYIAAQAPKKQTLKDFWRMVWEQNCGKIVMLTNLVEKTKVKCERYWNTEAPLQAGIYTVTVLREEKRTNWTIRELTVTQKGKRPTKTVLQFHFTVWPDHGVPEVTSLMEFVWRVRKTKSSLQGPLLVHCSAGIGRTGTYISTDYCLDRGQSEQRVDVFGYVSQLRSERKDMIQTHEQYKSVHLALAEAFSMGDTTLSSQKFRERISLSRVFQMGNCSEAKLLRVLNNERKALRNTGKAGQLWVNGRQDHYAAQVLSYLCKHGYVLSEVPSLSSTEGFWKMVEDQESDVVVFLPEASKYLPSVCPERGANHWNSIAVRSRKMVHINNELACRNIQLKAKSNPGVNMNVNVYSTSTSSQLTLQDFPDVINHLDRPRNSEGDSRPMTVVFGPKEKQDAVMFCVISNILQRCIHDDEVEIFNNTRRLSYLFTHDVTKSDLASLYRSVPYQADLDRGSVYVNVSDV